MKQSKKDIMLCEKDALQDLLDAEKLLDANFFVLTPNTANPYQRMYTNN